MREGSIVAEELSAREDFHGMGEFMETGTT